MKRARRIWNRLCGSIWRARYEKGLKDFNDEIQSHLAMHTEDNLRLGLSPEQARRVALLAFGNLNSTKENYYDQLGLPQLEALISDVKYALRRMRASPAFTATAVLSLSLGIGATTAIFSVIDALMLKTLPVARPEQLVAITSWSNFLNSWTYTYSYGEFDQLRERTSSFSSMAAICPVDRSNVTIHGTGGGQDAGQVRVGIVSGNYFSALGVQPAIGRTFTAEDDRASGASPVAVISHAYWKRRFALDAAITGRTFALNGTTYTILGVTADSFSGDQVGQFTDMWIPISMAAQVLTGRPALATIPVRIIARLKQDITLVHAQSEAQAVHHAILREIVGPGVPEKYLNRIELQSDARGISLQRHHFEWPLKIVMAVVVLVLLIACANVANLMLARAAARQREMAIRLSLGAGRGRILRQLLTESVLLAILSGGLGLLFAEWGSGALAKLAGSGVMAVDLDLRPDARMLGFTASLCLLSAILFGFAPAFAASNTEPSRALKGGSSPSGRLGMSRSLVVLQVAVSLVLLVGAGLFVRTLRNLRSQDLGFDRERVLTVSTAPEQSGRKGAALADLFQAVQQGLSSVPGIISVSPSSAGLLSAAINPSPVTVKGHPREPGDGAAVPWNIVAPRYFETVGIRLVAGRDFSLLDNAKSPRVAIVNETMARYYFGRPDPVGKRFGMRRDTGDEIEIIGVVKDAKYNTVRDEKLRMIYLPFRQETAHLSSMAVAVRAAGNLAGMEFQIHERLRNIDPTLAIVSIDSIEQDLDKALTPERLVAWLSGFFGALAVLLSCIGLYGVVSYAVTLRRNEIGVRMALGATRMHVMRIVFRDSLALTVLGIALGLPLVFASTRFTANQLFGISPSDLETVALSTATFILVGALAGLIPARRAARLDPMVALRHD